MYNRGRSCTTPLRQPCNVWNGDSELFETDLESLTQAQHLERFGELVLADSALHEQLRATPNEAAFIELAIRLAAERGCELTALGLQTAINQKRRALLERWL